MAFRITGEVSYLHGDKHGPLPSVTVSGLRKSVRLINYKPKTTVLIVLFREYGASLFFDCPLNSLFGRSVSLADLSTPTEMALISERLEEARNNDGRIRTIQDFLWSKLRHAKSDSLVLEAITQIKAQKGSLKISDLTDHLCVSDDVFEKRFRKLIGSTPKQFATMIRMKTVLEQATIPDSFTDLALKNGYYDQSHFNREFKLFTGLTPTQFYQSATYW